MKLKALLFDVDGTLADTEKDGHRMAFNVAFKEKGLDWEWDEKLYGELLSVSGGKERMTHYAKNYLNDFKMDNHEESIKILHRNKTNYYIELLKQSKIELRVGVKRLIEEAKSQNMRMAIVTTTSFENVQYLVENTLGKNAMDYFELIACGDIVPDKKPAPDIYLWALEKMKLNANEVLAFEDSYNGVTSATTSHIKTIATINEYTKNEDTSKAELIINQLGDKENPMQVIQGDGLGYEYINMEMIKKWF